MAPDKSIHIFARLSHFIDDNQHLFDPKDLIKKDWSSGAISGLGNLRPGRKKQCNVWKGWTWYFRPGEQVVKKRKDRLLPFALKSPLNVVYEGVGIAKFVMEHQELFDPEDLAAYKYRRHPNRVGRCRAEHGLTSLNPTRKTVVGSWKGWTWVSITERLEKCVELERDKIQETKQ